MKSTDQGKLKLIDRFAICFLSSLLAFLTGTIIWLVIVGYSENKIGFYPVYMFTGLAGILGFLLLENLVLMVLAPLWQAICAFFRNL